MTFKFPEPAMYELLKPLVTGGDVFRKKAPKNQRGLFIVYQRIDRADFGKQVLNRSAGTPGTAQAFIQVDTYGEDAGAVDDLSTSVEYTLDGYSGIVYHGGNSPQDSVTMDVSLQNETDTVDQTDEPSLFRNSAVYLVTYKQ